MAVRLCESLLSVRHRILVLDDLQGAVTEALAIALF